MRMFFDTEFMEDGRTIDLISIGIVSEDGREYYAETQCDLSKANPWVKKNVIPLLTGERKTLDRIASEIVTFAGKDPEFWAYYAAYDWVALCQLYGTMMDLPDGWPMFCLDIKQEMHRGGVKSIQRPEGGDHNALADARWNRRAWESLR